ncbi:MAG: restriction endonuclease subunit S [Candidatus Saccharibacteria bacterium]|nr:restriction endonuclease subunit S [Candidatus Saccharibacteria bacterium]
MTRGLLGDVVDIVKGISYRSSDYSNSEKGIAFVNLKSVARGGGYNPDGIKYYAGQIKANQYVEAGDILIANTDLTQNREIIGSPIIMPNIDRTACFSLDLSKIVIKKPDVIYPKYLFYYLKSPLAREFMLAHSNGSTVMHLSIKSVPNMEIKIPSIEKQKKIADILDTLDEKIELNRRINETLEQIGQALFRHYFIDNPDVNNWEEKSLDEIANYLNGLAMQKYPKIEGEPTLPVIKIREMSNGITDNTDIARASIPEKYIIHAGDLLFSWSGTLIVKFWDGVDGALNQHLFKVTSDKYPEWLYYYWTKHYLNEFTHIAKTKATTMGHIQRRHLKESKVLIPPNIDELTGIFEPIINQIKNNNNQIQDLSIIRDSLLPKLTSGREG